MHPPTAGYPLCPFARLANGTRTARERRANKKGCHWQPLWVSAFGGASHHAFGCSVVVLGHLGFVPNHLPIELVH